MIEDPSLNDVKYCAGLIDTDGSFKFNRKNKKFSIAINMVPLQGMQLCQSIFGGKIYPRKVRGNRRDQHQWGIANIDKLKNVVKLLGPHLIDKFDRPKIFDKYFDLQDSRIKGSRWTEEQKIEFNLLCDELHLANARGKDATAYVLEDIENKDIDPSQIAGAMDGDGSLMITKDYRVYICFKQTTNNYQQLFKRKYGGHIGVVGTNCPNGRVENYKWQLYGPNAEKFLLDILPYLRIKRKQAELCLDLIALRKTKIGRKVPPYMKKEFERIYWECKNLNKTGRSVNESKARALN